MTWRKHLYFLQYPLAKVQTIVQIKAGVIHSKLFIGTPKNKTQKLLNINKRVFLVTLVNLFPKIMNNQNYLKSVTLISHSQEFQTEAVYRNGSYFVFS